ncbi:MAG: dTMP kinase [Candidatus Berkelbacteria bacterium Gr01-1014_85]|uniref:Thymidylate kinase n=1 Tax=Candidatus Berkelbacteria bacterium Gr01-1014_85 TaxID=2017150 RepID=A0A554JD10_9BACT|nr:MAG: dTMP kinase [Candidatus Berkelbacteria bacterium Gr01-1014_85]
MQNKAGFLISFEGGDGVGKTTQIQILTQRLIDLGYSAQDFRELMSTELGREVRRLTGQTTGEQISPLAEVFLFQAGRAEAVNKLYRPALANGKIVILDRFIDSSVVFQGFARGLGAALIEELNQISTAQLKPNLTICLTLDPIEAASRITKIRELDRFEAAGEELQKSVQAGYDYIAQSEPNRFCLVDGRGTIEAVAQRIEAIVLERLNDNSQIDQPNQPTNQQQIKKTLNKRASSNR